MRILTNGEQLVGKTVAFAHIAQFATAVTLATTDNEVIVFEPEYDFEEEDMFRSRIRIYQPYRAIEYIENHNYVREELGKKGIFDIEAYKQKEKERREQENKKLEELKEKREREAYERLKLKFEK
ncbi:hypothetical protein CHH91_04505 [Virgibacillus sp. 7505]|uniref:hypothetical protein n=1 Tax=Virgibacillus sp. 7505 TaxID=2022548 RepID=UPI000BA53A38|nr:hypothetical protein [Virgibacillus sp. 7505]PAE17273.1 hypothetical protein CHH91_04505 [Virgibacillus sp. 7505]